MRSLSRRTLTLLVGFAVLIVIGVVGSQIPVQYAAMAPGPTYNTLAAVDGNQVIALSGRTPDETDGHLNMTTVAILDNLDIFSALRGWFQSDEAVIPREQVFPPGKSEEEVEKQQTQEFVSSQNSAVSAALSELGYPSKVVIAGLSAESPSTGRLRVDDVIEQVNGTKITSYKDLKAALGKHKPGDEVTVAYERDRKQQETRVVTTELDGKPALGVEVSFHPVAPFDVTIHLADVGGPSAGLMFALGIIDKVEPGSLTDGKFIAGTGMISETGKVGPIGGIQQKLIAADRAGATVFLVPAGNCADAKSATPDGLQTVKVNSLKSALSALEKLRDGGTPNSC